MDKYKRVLIIAYFILLAVSVAINLKLLYVLFVVAATITLIKEFSVQSVWRVVIWAAMLPDNYSPIVIMCIAGVYTLFAKRKSIKIDKELLRPFIALLVVATVSTYINRVPLINIGFALVYFSSIMMMMLIFGLCGTDFIDKSIVWDLRVFMASQIVAAIVKIISYDIGINIFKIDDWCTGTYGASQGPVVYMTMMLCCITELMLLVREKSKCVWRYILLIISAILMVATQSITIMAVSALFFFIGLICKFDKWSFLFAAIGIVGMIAACLFVFVFLHDKVDILNRASGDADLSGMMSGKALAYEDTFVTFPCEDVKYALIGDGFGNYCSRGALTCSGYYVEAYNRFFQPSVSERVQSYIQPQLRNAYFNSMWTMYGSILSHPYSSILALMGECGYIGVILFFIIFGVLYKRGDRMMHSLLLAYLGTCMLENYLEYSKVIIILTVGLSIGYSTLKNNDMKVE